MSFYKSLNYSLGNEDWSAEAQALQVKAGDKVICVTASGDRPLHLMMTDCDQIISIDMNRIQNYLFELKLAAIRQLDYEKYLAFLGCTPASNRFEIFQQIKSALPTSAAKFWQQQKKMIERGVIYQGRIERLTSLASKFFNLARSQKNRTLLSFTDLAEQRDFVQKKWDTHILGRIFETFIHPRISRLMLDDPGLNSYVEYARKPGRYIYQRMLDYLHNGLASKSPLIQLLLTGKITPAAYFPYLTFDGYQKIRRHNASVITLTGNVVEYLNQLPANEINGFSMSDIASYMPQHAFESLLRGIAHAGKPDARFCLREFISKRYIPENLTSYFQRDEQLEMKLEKEESNFVYRFMTGTLKNNFHASN